MTGSKNTSSLIPRNKLNYPAIELHKYDWNFKEEIIIKYSSILANLNIPETILDDVLVSLIQLRMFTKKDRKTIQKTHLHSADLDIICKILAGLMLVSYSQNNHMN